MSSVPVASSLQTARHLAQFILTAGYTEAKMKSIGLTKTPWKWSPERLLLSHKVEADSPLLILIQLFFYGEDVRTASASAALPSSIIASLLDTGMVSQDKDQLMPNCMLVHFGDLLIACDSVRRVRTNEVDDLVLGVNRPTQILGNCIIPLAEPGGVIDLGTGCGTLAFAAASSASHVIGTDINERALSFASFNSALNGVSNFEVRAGDRFAPVLDRKADLVISNPPFFLTPASKLLFTDNPFTLDSFVESLARQVPAILNENGYFQMLCEWVQFRSGSWKDRLGDWFSNSGCDAFVLVDYEVAPADYVLQRAAEAAALHGETNQQDILTHMLYFDEQNVEKIFGGLVTMRRRTTAPEGSSQIPNWIVVEETGGRPTSPIGHQILDRFAAQDILAQEGDARLLASKPRIAKDVMLIAESEQANRNWKTKLLYLERRSGLSRRLAFNSEIAELVSSWDGSQDLDFLVTVFARKKGLPKKQVSHDFLSLTRRLAALGLVNF